MSHYKTTYLKNISSMGLLTDRVITDTLTLPHDFTDIKIKPNELVTSITYNNVVDKLNKNFLYIVSYGALASNDLPLNYTNFLSGNSSSFNYYPTTSYASLSSYTEIELDGGFFTTTPTEITEDIYMMFVGDAHTVLADGDLFVNAQTDPVLYNVNDITFAGNGNVTAGVICDSNTVILLSAMADTTSPYLSASITSETEVISPVISSDRFSNIKATQKDSNNDIYILNENSIMKFDISGALNGDRSLLGSTTNGRTMINKDIGGKGEVTDQIKFNNAINFSVFDDTLYVIDVSGSNAFYIKEYDTNFNFKQTYNVSSSLLSYTIADIMATQSSVFVLTSDGHIIDFAKDFKTSTLHEPDSISKRDKFRKLEQCASDNNVFYVLTKSDIYKKFISKPSKTIGKFKINETKLNIYNPDFIAISSRLLDNKEELFIADNNSASVYRFIEDIEHQEAFFDTFQTQIFPVSSLQMNAEEYLNSFTFNKSFSKILFNHFVLKENARAKFQGTFDSTGLLQYDGLKYPLDSEIEALEYNISNDNYVGINEIFLSETINRPIKKIYDLQILLLDFIKERRTNSYPLSAEAVTLPL